MLLSAVIIACNEEKRIQACLDSLQFADEMVVVDSGSHDRTPEIARKADARVFTRLLDNFAAQRNYAMSLAEGKWILFIDADERITLELRVLIEKTIRDPAACDGYTILRINHILGGPMLHGANSKDYPLRLVKKGKGEWQGLVHEKLVVDGTVGSLSRELQHVTTQSLDEYFSKFNLYTKLDAREMIRKGEKIPNWFTIIFRPWAEFVYYYFIRRGFLDGSRGFTFQLLSSFYLLVKYLKVRELAKEKDLKAPGETVI